MTRYTIILFYNNGNTKARNIESLGDAIAIEAGALSAWYHMAMVFNTSIEKYHLTGCVVIDNKNHTVVNNESYL